MEERNNCFVSGALIIAGVIGILYTRTMSRSAAKYPMIVLWLIIILSAIFLVRNILAMHGKAKADPEAEPQPRQPVFSAREWGVVGIAILYVIVLRLIGFLPASLLLFVGLAVYVGYRKWVKLGVIAVCSVAVIYYIFFRYLSLSYIYGRLFR